MSNSDAVDVDMELAQLLKEQEQFLQQNKKPAAKVSRLGGAPKVNQVQEKPRDQQDDAPKVLGQVVERSAAPMGQSGFKMIAERRPKAGFPVVKRREPGQSLFGRRRRQEQAATKPAVKAQEVGSLDQESKDIDAANKARLKEMSPQEILEAQQELLKSLDPKLIEKLKNRRKSKQESGKRSVTTKKEAPKDAVIEKKVVVVPGKAVVTAEALEEERKQKEEEIKRLASITTEEDLQKQAQQLPLEERAKLDWTKTTEAAKTSSDAAGAAKKKIPRPDVAPATLERFDLDGNGLEATDADLPVHSGLFHHGDDPDAAGYTVPELLHLARSSVASQRAMALSVLAKILRNRQIQQNSSLPVKPRVLPRDMAISLRVVLDDQNYTALSAGVTALHSFIVPVDSATPSLEDIYAPELKHGVVVMPPRVHLQSNAASIAGKDKQVEQEEEVVYIDTSEADDGSSISDEDLAALDPVQALLNMDLGTRLRYVLETIQLPDQYATEKMLDILIAVARHSPRAAHEISSNARLIKLLQQQYIENEQVLTFQADNVKSLRLTLKALELVKALCQGQRSVATALITSGVIQSTKGFLALKETPTDSNDDEGAALFSQLQVESLRIWRVLLGYGLDFHCFAYLFPVLSGFMQNATEAVAPRTAALFAALEAFCSLGALHEAQHYFNQLGFFMTVAKDEAIRCIGLLNSTVEHEVGTTVELAAVLRFLASASTLATKFSLETAGLQEVLKLVQTHEVTQKLLPQLADSVSKCDLLLAIVRFQRQVLRAGFMPDDLDDEEVTQTFAREVKTPLLTAATSSVAASSTAFSTALIQACELTILLGELIDKDTASFNADFVQDVYHQGLILVEKLGSGGEYWIARLFTSVLFHQTVLRSLGIFNDEADAIRMSRVLTPIYQALVNATCEQENHSAQVFISAVDKFSWHLRLPQEEQSYLPSNLPLPSFWMLSPLSRIEYSSNGADDKFSSDTNPTRAQSEEMKLIVSATCRFVFEFERLAPQLSSIPSIAELRPEDKLFHLVHVFFAGSDVLFDDHVDAALRQLLPKLLDPILRSSVDSRLLYEGILRNLKRFESLETGTEPAPAPTTPSAGFASDDQQVLTFVEKLMAEYTASSYGNVHFAQCVSLLLARDFSLMLRKFVWKELQDCHLLHTLEPLKAFSALLLKRCTVGGVGSATDDQLLQLMQQALCTQSVSPTRGAFAYSVAIHHLVAYLSPEDNTLSFARQQVAQTLATSASPAVWGHLLSYDVKNPTLLDSCYDEILPQRLERLRSQAAFTRDQLLAFEASVSLVSSRKATK